MKRHEEVLLGILASSVSGDALLGRLPLPLDDAGWAELVRVAKLHGVASLVADAIQKLPKERLPERKVVMLLIAHVVMQTRRYAWQVATANKLALVLKEYGVVMKVLKGISFSTYYHKPELRECGDCDIYLGSDFEVGNSVVRDVGGTSEFGTYKHSHMHLNGLLIENHRYITDFNGTKRGKALELLLQKYAGLTGERIKDTELVRPCAQFNALHMMRHAYGNFIADGMSVRMIYDWAVFLKHEQYRLDWGQLYEDLDACHLRKFVDVMVGLCVRFFGLSNLNDCIGVEKNANLLDEIMLETLRNEKHLVPNESLCHKTSRILARFKRMWHYRKLAIESVPRMIWNAFAFSSYMRRNLELE